RVAESRVHHVADQTDDHRRLRVTDRLAMLDERVDDAGRRSAQRDRSQEVRGGSFDFTARAQEIEDGPRVAPQKERDEAQRGTDEDSSLRVAHGVTGAL